MNKQRITLTLALVTSAWIAPSTQAQTLDLTLLDANQTVVQGTTTVAFDATIVNPSTTATIYLNAASASAASSLLTVDISPFFANAPFSLAPGQSSGAFELFAVDFAPNTPVGSYIGNDFQVQGGADGGTLSAFNDLADAHFSISVTSAVPEPSTYVLMLAGICLLGFESRRRVSDSRGSGA